VTATRLPLAVLLFFSSVIIVMDWKKNVFRQDLITAKKNNVNNLDTVQKTVHSVHKKEMCEQPYFVNWFSCSNQLNAQLSIFYQSSSEVCKTFSVLFLKHSYSLTQSVRRENLQKLQTL